MSQIKSRLKTAYENIEFHASNTWNNDFSNTYQKANQELFVREKKVQSALAEELLRPRTVRDCIPNSRLAKYANYEYNESRELCYATSANKVSFYYPCLSNRASVSEPWMLPEVEQLFIWFTHTPKYNILEILQMEETNQFDKDSCRCRHFHEVCSITYDTFEKTPGKSRYKKSKPLTQNDILRFTPSCQFKVETFEDMVLRMQIRSENIKYLWSQEMKSKWQTVESRNVTFFKTLMGNYFVINVEDDLDNKEEGKLTKKSLVVTDFQFRKNDCLQLQNLLNAMQSVESLFLKTGTQFQSQRKQVNTSSKRNEPPPTRRLYSAVLQGSSRDLQKNVSIDSILPSACFSTLSPMSSVLNNSSSSSPNSSRSVLSPAYKSTPVLQNSRVSKVSSSSSWETFNFQPKSLPTDADGTLKHSTKPPSVPKVGNWVTQSRNIHYSSSNVEPSVNSYNFNEAAAPLESRYKNYYNSNNNVYFSNMYGSNSFFNNSCYNSQYVSNSQPPNQGPSVNYRNVCVQYIPPVHISLPNSAWSMRNNKPPTNYNFTHYATHPYVFVPTQINHPRSMQQYSPQNSTRLRTAAPSNLSPCHFPMQCNSYNSSSVQQYGSLDGRINSNHKMPFLCSENQHSFMPNRKFTDSQVENNFQQNRSSQINSWFHERPSEMTKTYTGNCLKQSSSTPILNYHNKSSLKGDVRNGSSTAGCKNPLQVDEINSQESLSLQRRRTASEELELLAVMQYQTSRDDLEKEAEEQYSSENWMSPPYNSISFGGLFNSIAICAV